MSKLSANLGKFSANNTKLSANMASVSVECRLSGVSAGLLRLLKLIYRWQVNSHQLGNKLWSHFSSSGFLESFA